jgi:phosphoesterase RecJ-like protein
MAVAETVSITELESANRNSIATLLDLFRQRETFLLTSHARPDGDALGSALGLMYLLEGMGKQVTVAFEDPIPAIYKWLPGALGIQTSLTVEPEVVIVLECDSIERTGYTRKAFEHMAPGMIVNIDHHLSGKMYADTNWIDSSACAVGAMIYDLAIASGTAISADMATCLYTAVLTDTGRFTYPGTSAATFALASHLVQCGADSSAIARQVYLSNTTGRIRALGEALSTMQIEQGVAWAWITEEQMERAGAVVEDCEGIVNYLIGIAEVKVAAFLRELPHEGAGLREDGGPRQFRLSLRSGGDVDVAEIAAQFGGGGHREASGCTLEGPLERAVEAIKTAMRAMLPGRGIGAEREVW